MTGLSPDEGGRTGGAADRPLISLTPLKELPQPADDRVAVGVIDTGIVVLGDEPHPFIAEHLAADWRSQPPDLLPSAGQRPSRYEGHGTFLCGLILKQAPTATIHMRTALDRSAPDNIENNDRFVAEAIRSLIKVPNLKVINLSFFGNPEREREAPPGIQRALEELFCCKNDVLVVTAAANRWTAEKTWPAAFNEDFERVIAVGAVDESVIPVSGLPPPRASFCSFWPGLDAYASGVRVVGPGLTAGTPGYAFGSVQWSGNSFAAATVTGLLARATIDLPGLQAKAQVIKGPPVPVPGLPENRWKPYVRAQDSTWPLV